MSSTPPPPPPPPPDSGDRGDQPAPSDPGHGAEPPGFGPEPAAQQRNTMAVVALVLGLIAFPGILIIGFVPVLNLLTILTPVAAIVAIVLGIVGIRRAKRPGVAGGVGMGVTGIVLGAINLLLVAAFVAGAVMFLRTCPDVTDAANPGEAMQRVTECFEEEGFLAPGEAEQLEEQLEQQGLPEDMQDM